MITRFGSAPRQTKRELNQLRSRIEQVRRAVVELVMERDGLSEIDARLHYLRCSRVRRDDLARAAGFDPHTFKKL